MLNIVKHSLTNARSVNLPADLKDTSIPTLNVPVLFLPHTGMIVCERIIAGMLDVREVCGDKNWVSFNWVFGRQPSC